MFGLRLGCSGSIHNGTAERAIVDLVDTEKEHLREWVSYSCWGLFHPEQLLILAHKRRKGSPKLNKGEKKKKKKKKRERKIRKEKNSERLTGRPTNA
jgi:hypothetical protein